MRFAYRKIDDYQAANEEPGKKDVRRKQKTLRAMLKITENNCLFT